MELFKVNVQKIKQIDNTEDFDDMLSEFCVFGKKNNVVSFDVIEKDGQLSLIQIATEKVFLIDIFQLKSDPSWEKLGNAVFNNANVTKLCFDLRPKLCLIKQQIPEMGMNVENVQSYIDLKEVWKFMAEKVNFEFSYSLHGDYQEDLQRLAAITLGKPLNKNETHLNWLNRPLTMPQIIYASCNVEAMLEVFSVLNTAALQYGINLLSINDLMNKKQEN